MTRTGSRHRDKGPESILSESRIVNEEGAKKARKLMVPEGQRKASVVTPASFPPVTNRLGRIVVFISFVVARLVPLFSTFFLQILDTFGIQLAHLSLNSVVILAIFAYFCDMFMGVPPSVALFRHFFMLQPAGKKRGSFTADIVGCCNFQLRDSLAELYIPEVLRGKWDDWRCDWFYVDVSPHDRLTLSEVVAEPQSLIWETAPAEDERMWPVLNCINDLRQAGLTSVMVVAYYLRRRLAPLRERARPCWIYMGPQDIIRIQIGEDCDLGGAALAGLLWVMTGVEDLTWAVPRDLGTPSSCATDSHCHHRSCLYSQASHLPSPEHISPISLAHLPN